MEFSGLPAASAMSHLQVYPNLQVYPRLKVKGIPLERTVVVCTKPYVPKALVDETVPFVLEMLQV